MVINVSGRDGHRDHSEARHRDRGGERGPSQLRQGTHLGQEVQDTEGGHVWPRYDIQVRFF